MTLLRFAVLILSAWIAQASNFYVSTNGTGDGSLGNPWSLQTALTSSSLHPGDTVWLRSGTYFPILSNNPNYNVLTNTFQWVVMTNKGGGNIQGFTGSAGNPITMRSYSNEWAAIDRPWVWDDTGVFTGWAVFRDLEFYNSQKGMMPTNLSNPNGPWIHFNFKQTWVTNITFINCVLHDIDIPFAAPVNPSVRGCVIWHVGLNTLEHVCYPGILDFSGNIVAYASNTTVEHGTPGGALVNNIIFGDAYTIDGGGIIGRVDEPGDFSIVGNSIYDYWAVMPTHGPGQGFDIANGNNRIITNNVIFTGTPLLCQGVVTNSLALYGNTIHLADTRAGNGRNWFLSTFAGCTVNIDSNKYSASPAKAVSMSYNSTIYSTFAAWRAAFPSQDAASTAVDSSLPSDSVKVYVNADQSKRGHIAVYNFSHADNVTVDVSSVLSSGDTYQLYSAQNYNYGVIKSGTVSGTTISVPMTNLTAAPVLYGTNWGLVNPAVTSPEFGAFVLLGQSPPTIRATLHNATLRNSSL